MMNLKQVITEHPGVNITVNATDLQEFGQNIADQTARTILERKDEKIYSRDQIIEKFGICSATLWRWGKNGKLKGRRINGRLFYPESEIKRLIE